MFPSRTYRFSLKTGLQGHDVWALQINLNDLGNRLAEDGDFGSATDLAVKSFQGANNLVVDGVAGPLTQRVLALDLIKRPEAANTVPAGLLKGLVEGEAGFLVGAVNWSVPGGVDCGYVQRRVYDTNYTDGAFRAAFSGRIQFTAVASELRTLKDAFYGRTGAPTHRRAWELAILNHNWPAAAERLSKGLSIYVDARRDTTPADWVIAIGVSGVETPRQWADYYIESKTHYVTNWNA